MFSVRSSGYQLGCTTVQADSAVSAQRPVEHVKSALQNTATEGTKHSVSRAMMPHNFGHKRWTEKGTNQVLICLTEELFLCKGISSSSSIKVFFGDGGLPSFWSLAGGSW